LLLAGIGSDGFAERQYAVLRQLGLSQPVGALRGTAARGKQITADGGGGEPADKGSEGDTREGGS